MARTTGAWLEHFAGAVPAAPVHDLRAALTSDYVRDEDRVWPYPHPERPEFRMVPPAFRLPGEEMPRRAGAACGADTGDVLREIGYSEERIALLRRAGVI